VKTPRDNKKPPDVVWVSYCVRCGEPIFAGRKRQDTSCPTCPIVGLTKRQFPKIRHARYRLEWSR
jgi:hypothetical protein